MKTHEVFGIQPNISEHSYIDRGSLDKTFRKLIERQQTHIAIRGASKSGKSWLRQRVLTDPIIVQCRLSYTTADIYRDVLARLNIAVELEATSKSSSGGKVGGGAEGGFKFIAKASVQGEMTHGTETATKEKVVGRDVDDLEFVAQCLRESGRTLVIEDFHYLSVNEQRKFAFDLKTLWDYKTFVVVVGVWISENMLITLNPDLADRIEELSVTWQNNELKDVFKKGCGELGLRTTEALADNLAEISYESVGLLQKLALRLIDDELDITERTPDGTIIEISNLEKLKDAAMHVADQLNQLYQAFAKRVCDGIRKRANSTGIYAHAMKAIMAANDAVLVEGMTAKQIYDAANAAEPRIHLGNLKTVLARFPDLQVDSEGRGLILAYTEQREIISVVDKQLLLYRRFATVKWPWEELIAEVSQGELAFTD
ncbi:hypothetical protein [Burkholderia ubonensis]|uniref:hypothetical protein n=1 Tax=Burkholderia ubonensis TaxID=101571 RepID=UPI000841F58D|nr:hypothetical protein [Burkholderia ubonensis]